MQDLGPGEPATITLRDGRRLAYADWGDPQGMPVVHHHGVPGSRLEHVANPGLYADLGVRVITPDRPGYGFSDHDPRRTLVSWAADVGQLADQLGIDRFAVTSLSGGGMYALACAAMMPHRVTRVELTGCPAPMDLPGALRELSPLNRRVLWLAAKAPWLVEAVIRGGAALVRRNPSFFVRQTNRRKPASDLRWLMSPEVWAGATETLREAMRSGGHGYARDLVLLSKPWGFEVEAIAAPVDVWQGDLDTVIPPVHGLRLAARLRRATLRRCRGEAHMLMWAHVTEILGAVAEAAA